jgi:hypothetical protein
MRARLLLICASLVVTGCVGKSTTTNSGSPAPQTSISAAANAASPQTAQSQGTTAAATPAYTGPATLQHGADGPSIYGKLAADGTFSNCYASPVPIASGDTIYPHGTCTAEKFLKTAASHAALQLGSDATVSGVTVDGDTAIASYTRAGESGQILLTQSALGWTAVTSVKRAFVPADTIGIDPQRLQTLQTRVRAQTNVHQ